MNKVIQCVWLGGPRTKLAEKCRASWERFAPDWEIREWNEIPAEAPSYVRKALQKRKWAFASDWMRFWVLEREGGVYLDYDVELVKPLTDALRKEGLDTGEWCAREKLKHGGIGWAPGAGIALEKNSAWAEKMLEIYAVEDFDGTTTVGDLMSLNGVCPKPVDPEVFCPYDGKHCLRRTNRTIAIHHYALSWITPRRRIARWMSWHGLEWIVQFLLRMRGRIAR